MMKKLLFLLSMMFIITSSLLAQSVGVGLATINDGRYHTETEPLVKRYNSIVSVLDNKYVEDQMGVCDMTSVMKKELTDIGVETPLINIMEGIARLSDNHTRSKKYKDNVVCYIIFRHNGSNHEQALSEMQNLLKSYSMDVVMQSLGLQ